MDGTPLVPRSFLERNFIGPIINFLSKYTKSEQSARYVFMGLLVLLLFLAFLMIGDFSQGERRATPPPLLDNPSVRS